MKKKGRPIMAIELLILAVLFALGGCGKSESPVGPTSSADDEISLRVYVEENPELFSYGIDDGSEGSRLMSEDSGLAKGIEPVAFWREITSRERDMDVHIVHPGGDSISYADVTITTYFWGIFHTVTMEGEYTKEIEDTAVRYAYFEREHHGQSQGTGHRYGGWVLKKVSGWEVSSNPCTKEIYSLQITSSSGLVDTTITDVSSLWDLSALFVFDSGDSVTLTVDTGNPDDLVFLHAPQCVRRPFQHIGGGLYTGTWVIAEDSHHAARPRHAAVDVIDRGTVFDDQVPYDSRAWGLVYFVGEGPEAD